METAEKARQCDSERDPRPNPAPICPENNSDDHRNERAEGVFQCPNSSIPQRLTHFVFVQVREEVQIGWRDRFILRKSFAGT